MKKLLLLLIFIGVGYINTTSAKCKKNSSCCHKEKAIAPVAPAPKFDFKDGDCYDFKSVKYNSVVTHTFQFTNDGDKPLFIDNVTTSNSAVSVKRDVEPILPGFKGHIYVTVNTKDLKGEFYKEIYILSNAKVPLNERRYTLFVAGIVETESYKDKDHKVAGKW